MRIILIDNYDSFTWNIVHYLEQCNCHVEVVMNDALVSPNWENYDACVISPGPGLPAESGHLLQWISSFPDHLHVLGICLGLQALVVSTGGELINLSAPLHGQEGRAISLGKSEIWKDMRSEEIVAHYHSWVADPETISDQWCIGFVSKDNLTMTVEHNQRKWSAVQFHPESILTENGIRWFEYWLQSFR